MLTTAHYRERKGLKYNMYVDEGSFLWLGKHMVNRTPVVCTATEDQRFHAVFGTCAAICSHIWMLLIEYQLIQNSGKPIHLLWALMFMKLYNSESVNCIVTGVDDHLT